MIYIVDDDSAIRDSLRLLLECAGLEAREFASGRQFLEARRADDEECLILDIHMPGMGGLELLESLRERGDRVPVILITGHPTGANHNRARSAGVLAILEKPFKPTEILGLIHRALESRTPKAQ